MLRRPRTEDNTRMKKRKKLLASSNAEISDVAFRTAILNAVDDLVKSAIGDLLIRVVQAKARQIMEVVMDDLGIARITKGARDE